MSIRPAILLAVLALCLPTSVLLAKDTDVVCSTTGNKNNAFLSLLFKTELPGKTDIFLHPEKSLHEFSSCQIKIFWPQDAPADAQIMSFVKDWDYYWYQNLRPGYLKPGKTNLISVSFEPTAKGWEPRGHYGAWCLRSTIEPTDLGFAILSKEKYKGKAQLISASFTPKTPSKKPPAITNLRVNKGTLPCHEKFEIMLELPDRYPDPFDSSKILLYAEFVMPDGSEQRVDGFYNQDYFRIEDKAEIRVSPQGKPYWCIRFAPWKEGRHSYRIIAEDQNGKTQWGPGSFQATKASKPGVVRVSRKDPRFFEFQNKEKFFPIGHNIRSPFDTRMDGNFPWTQRWPEGSSSYERYFRKMHASGQNMAEVWFAAWSMALEWKKEWFGYHGVGQYNLIHAFEMDRILELADKNDIYLNLVIHNHGKYSTFSDQEWADNPFNKANGGWLRDPFEFFTDEKALKSYLQLMRYKIARYGYSSHVFAWELWSELNLAGSRTNKDVHKRKECVAWHKFVSAAIKDMDPYDHMVSTHVSSDYTRQNPSLISLKGMDMCPVDAYHGSSDPLHIVSLINSTAEFNNPYKKPVLPTEFGGSWNAESKSYLEVSLHAGLWASTCIPIAGTPLFWWWGLIEEENYYPSYTAINKFMKDVDRRDPTKKTSHHTVMSALASTPVFKATVYHNKTEGQGWIYYTGSKWLGTLPASATTDDASLSLPDMANGVFDVEFWDTVKGEIILETTATSQNGQLVLKIPKFSRDIAFKIRTTSKPGAKARR